MTELQPFRFIDPLSGQTVAFDESYRDEEGTPYATTQALGKLLGYQDPAAAISHLLDRHTFIGEYVGVVKLATPSGTQDCRVFSPIAVFLICMKASTPRAREIQLVIARFLDAWRRGDFAPSRIPAAARQLDGVAFIELIKTQTLPKLFDQARRHDETGDYARGFLEALGFPKKPREKPRHDMDACPYRHAFDD